MPTNLTGTTARSAAEVAPHVSDVSDEAKALLSPAHTPGAYIDALAAAGHFADAVRFLAHAMGRRECVWWACVCNRLVLDPSMPPAAVAALVAAETWCYQPTEEHRRAAHAAAEAATLDHPPALAAMGAFFSGGSIAPAHVAQPVPPGPFHTARMVAGAVILCAVKREPQRAPERFRAFLAKGVEIANSAAAQSRPQGGV
jgi:hypothetical protein